LLPSLVRLLGTARYCSVLRWASRPGSPGRRCRCRIRPTKNLLAGGTGGCGRTRCGVRRQV